MPRLVNSAEIFSRSWKRADIFGPNAVRISFFSCWWNHLKLTGDFYLSVVGLSWGASSGQALPSIRFRASAYSASRWARDLTCGEGLFWFMGDPRDPLLDGRFNIRIWGGGAAGRELSCITMVVFSGDREELLDSLKENKVQTKYPINICCCFFTSSHNTDISQMAVKRSGLEQIWGCSLCYLTDPSQPPTKQLLIPFRMGGYFTVSKEPQPIRKQEKIHHIFGLLRSLLFFLADPKLFF